MWFFPVFIFYKCFMCFHIFQPWCYSNISQITSTWVHVSVESITCWNALSDIIAYYSHNHTEKHGYMWNVILQWFLFYLFVCVCVLFVSLTKQSKWVSECWTFKRLFWLHVPLDVAITWLTVRAFQTSLESSTLHAKLPTHDVTSDFLCPTTANTSVSSFVQNMMVCLIIVISSHLVLNMQLYWVSAVRAEITSH